MSSCSGLTSVFLAATKDQGTVGQEFDRSQNCPKRRLLLHQVK
jgi:hypothetical protein